MPFTLPPLPYAPEALEPVIDAQTMTIHHGKHHNGYVTNLNAALAGKADLEAKTLEALISDLASVPEAIRPAVRNNGGGHANHSLFWTLMTSPGKAGHPSADLTKAIDKDLGGMAMLKEKFGEAATKRFGSGWAWIVATGGKLVITSTPNQDNPLMKGVAEVVGHPILGLDVWEHAYYLKYQNRRPDYIKAWWDIVNWAKVSELYAKAK